jgi:hypothetical protein
MGPANWNYTHLAGLLNSPRIREMTKRTRKIKNNTLAMPTAAAAMPVNPKRAATMAITKKMAAHLSIGLPPA